MRFGCFCDRFGILRMKPEIEIHVFEAPVKGLYVVLTFTFKAFGRLSVEFSVRSHVHQDPYVLHLAQTIWQSWAAAIAGGSLPPLPQGWLYVGGDCEAVTSRSPNHSH